MAHLVWTDDLDTGIDVIDEQHRRIVGYINQLHDARTTRDAALIAEVIDGLVDYTVSHFAFEEALMADAGYDCAPLHKKVHELFSRRLGELQARFNRGENIIDELHLLLSKWLFNHIRHDDASYCSAVKARMQQLLADRKDDGWLARSLGRFFRRT